MAMAPLLAGAQKCRPRDMDGHNSGSMVAMNLLDTSFNRHLKLQHLTMKRSTRDMASCQWEKLRAGGSLIGMWTWACADLQMSPYYLLVLYRFITIASSWQACGEAPIEPEKPRAAGLLQETRKLVFHWRAAQVRTLAHRRLFQENTDVVVTKRTVSEKISPHWSAKHVEGKKNPLCRSHTATGVVQIHLSVQFKDRRAKLDQMIFKWLKKPRRLFR